jgi:hypothetical protein
LFSFALFIAFLLTVIADKMSSPEKERHHHSSDSESNDGSTETKIHEEFQEGSFGEPTANAVNVSGK